MGRQNVSCLIVLAIASALAGGTARADPPTAVTSSRTGETPRTDPAPGPPPMPAAPTLPPLPPSSSNMSGLSGSGSGLDFTYERIASGMRGCAGRKVTEERVHCYDALSSTLPMSTVGVGAWVLGLATAAVASTSVTSTEDALEGIKAALYVKCRDTQMEVYIGFGTPIAEKGQMQIPVTVRFDDLDIPAATPSWIPSVSKTAAGLWSNATSMEFIHRLSKSRRLSVRVTLPEEKIVNATFETKGADGALTPIVAACGSR